MTIIDIELLRSRIHDVHQSIGTKLILRTVITLLCIAQRGITQVGVMEEGIMQVGITQGDNPYSAK